MIESVWNYVCSRLVYENNAPVNRALVPLVRRRRLTKRKRLNERRSSFGWVFIRLSPLPPPRRRLVHDTTAAPPAVALRAFPFERLFFECLLSTDRRRIYTTRTARRKPCRVITKNTDPCQVRGRIDFARRRRRVISALERDDKSLSFENTCAYESVAR